MYIYIHTLPIKSILPKKKHLTSSLLKLDSVNSDLQKLSTTSTFVLVNKIEFQLDTGAFFDTLNTFVCVLETNAALKTNTAVNFYDHVLIS